MFDVEEMMYCKIEARGVRDILRTASVIRQRHPVHTFKPPCHKDAWLLKAIAGLPQEDNPRMSCLLEDEAAWTMR